MKNTSLRDVLAPGSSGRELSATVTKVRADGTVDLDLGGGQTAERIPVLQSSWTPESGATVAVMRFEQGQRLVLGPTRTSNPTTVTLTSELAFPYNVTPASAGAANPLVVAVTDTQSWRSLREGWVRDDVYQGAYSSSSVDYGYWRGLYFYGSTAFDGLAGRTCTSIKIRLARKGEGGSSGATPMWIGPHVHSSVPGGEPLFPWGAINVGSLTWLGSGTSVFEFDLPTAWGDLLISKQAAGFGHLRMAYGNGNYSINFSKESDGLSGRLTIGHA